jgi:hypothetical protein
MRHVSYAASYDGYIIRVYEDGKVIQEYADTVPDVLAEVYSDRRKVKAFAKATALTVAKDYHVIAKRVQYDERLEQLIPSPPVPQLASITVLNDSETFTGTRGCEVVEYDEANAPSYEDADEIVPLVLDGTVKGHVYSVPALVSLYKALIELPKPLVDGIKGELAFEILEKLAAVEQVARKEVHREVLNPNRY